MVLTHTERGMNRSPPVEFGQMPALRVRCVAGKADDVRLLWPRGVCAGLGFACAGSWPERVGHWDNQRLNKGLCRQLPLPGAASVMVGGLGMPVANRGSQ